MAISVGIPTGEVSKRCGGAMYVLRVYHPGSAAVVHMEHLTGAAEVLSRIPLMLAEYPGCERIDVFVYERRIFSVDCEGNTLPA